MKIDLLERRETDPAVIPKAALAQGELLGYEKLEVYIQPLSAVVLPGRMTALELLRPGGVMTVCVYYGGPQGMAEKDAVLAFLTGLPPEGYRVSVRDFSGRPGCPPIPVCIEKRAW